MYKTQMIGWDIGGAHLKAVLLNAGGEVENAVQLPCKLWLGIAELEIAISKALSLLNAPHAKHAVTMTGELVDGFANRSQGVQQIADCAMRLLGDNTQFYAGRAGFVAHSQVLDNVEQIASANWHASAAMVANFALDQDALLIDIGSTTTDLIPIKKGELAQQVYTDLDRLRTGELLYAGVVRTPLMALTKQIRFQNQNQSIAAEYFATTGDVYRLTDELAEHQFSSATADGGDKSQHSCARRLARMVGCDVEYAPMDEWVLLAQQFRAIQLKDLQVAIAFQLQQLKPPVQLFVAGAGSFLLPHLMPYFAVHHLHGLSQFVQASNTTLRYQASVGFPAYAVARLAQTSR